MCFIKFNGQWNLEVYLYTTFYIPKWLCFIRIPPRYLGDKTAGLTLTGKPSPAEGQRKSETTGAGIKLVGTSLSLKRSSTPAFQWLDIIPFRENRPFCSDLLEKANLILFDLFSPMWETYEGRLILKSVCHLASWRWESRTVRYESCEFEY